MKTIDYLNLIQKTYHKDGKPASDYRAAELLEVAKQTISRYRKHSTTFDDVTALKAAELLSIDPALIFADMQAERAKNEDARRVWETIGATIRASAAAPVILSALIALSLSNSSTFSTTYKAENLAQIRLFLILCKIGLFPLILSLLTSTTKNKNEYNHSALINKD